MKTHKTLKLALPTLALILASSCYDNQAVEPDREATKSDDELIKEAITENLLDPESARFGEVSTVSGVNGSFGCATVNSRNTFGGYKGDQQMLIQHDDPVWTFMADIQMSHMACMNMARSMANSEQDESTPKP